MGNHDTNPTEKSSTSWLCCLNLFSMSTNPSVEDIGKVSKPLGLFGAPPSNLKQQNGVTSNTDCITNLTSTSQPNATCNDHECFRASSLISPDDTDKTIIHERDGENVNTNQVISSQTDDASLILYMNDVKQAHNELFKSKQGYNTTYNDGTSLCPSQDLNDFYHDDDDTLGNQDMKSRNNAKHESSMIEGYNMSVIGSNTVVDDTSIYYPKF